MTENIDRTRLSTDLRYRFEYLSKFLNFSKNDIKTINKLATIIQPVIPVIVDNIYRKLFSFDITKEYFILRHSKADHCLPAKQRSLDFNSHEMEYQKNMLNKYLESIFTQQEWSDAFLYYLSHIGKIHTNKIRSSPAYVDYVHVAALCGYLEQKLISIILDSESIDNQTKQDGIMALNKLFWIQNDFFKMHYDFDLD